MSREFLYGRRPVMESLRAKRRAIKRVIFAGPPEESQPLAEIAHFARKAGARIETQRRRWTDEPTTPAVVSASSGAVEHLQVAQVTNLVNAIKTLKEQDIWIAGLDTGPDSVRYDKANLKGALGLVVGSEGSGLRRLVRERCDFIISL